MDVYSVDWFIAFFFSFFVLLALVNLHLRVRRLERSQESRPGP